MTGSHMLYGEIMIASAAPEDMLDRTPDRMADRTPDYIPDRMPKYATICAK